MKREYKKAFALIEKSKRILVMGHRNPEGDCICATLAIAHLLRHLGKTVVAYNQDPVPHNLRFLPLSDSIHNDLTNEAEFDLAVIVDCGAIDRVGAGKSYLENLPILNVDHHVTNNGFGLVNIVDPNASAAVEVIYDIMHRAGVKTDRTMAQYIYCGVTTDTGSFRYNNSSARAFAIAGKMVDLGINPWDINRNLYENQPIQRLHLIKYVLNTLSIGRGGSYASILISRKIMEDTKATIDMVDGLINYPRSIEGVEVAIQFWEIAPDTYKISLRSKGVVDVALISSRFNGGGHRNAAGFTINASLDEIQRSIFAIVEEVTRTTLAGL